MSLLPTPEDELKDLKMYVKSNETVYEWLDEEITKVKKLEEINEYYEEWLEETIGLLHFIEDDFQMRYGISLPKDFYERVQYITKGFKFKYLDNK